MKNLFFCVLFINSIHCFYAQNSTLNQQIINANSKSISLTVSSIPTNVKSIDIRLFQLINTDSLIVFEANVNLADIDTNPFLSLIQNDNNFDFGLGNYENGVYVGKIIFTRLDETTYFNTFE